MKYLWARPFGWRSMLAIAAVWMVFLAFFRNGWLESYNAASVAIWLPFIWLGGLVSALSAVRATGQRESSQDAIAQTSPRNRVGLAALAWLVDIVFLAVLPTLIVYGAVILLSTIASGVGYLDLSYGVFAVIYSSVLVLLGRLIDLVVQRPLLAPAIAFAVSIFFGAYTIFTGRDVNVWSAFDTGAIVLVVVMTVVVASALVGAALTRRVAVRRGLAVAGLASAIAAVLVLGPVDLTVGSRTASETDYTCVKRGVDSVCVWRDDLYKLDGLAQSASRARAVADAAGLELGATVFAEPGLPVGDGSLVAPLWAIGGSPYSWPAAQSIAIFMLTQDDPKCSSETAWEDHFFLADLLSNYVYGDIEYGGFATSNPQGDARRSATASSLAALTEGERVAWLASAIRQYSDTCSVSDLVKP